MCVLPPELGCLVGQLPDAVLEGRDLAWLVRRKARQIPDGQANRFRRSRIIARVGVSASSALGRRGADTVYDQGSRISNARPQ
ncbi:MAG: hypothetical protein JO046_07820 [Solirubrobacterales bacterium]|nr:hypothetical protein [Solirubrobacterales bacterium]